MAQSAERTAVAQNNKNRTERYFATDTTIESMGRGNESLLPFKSKFTRIEVGWQGAKGWGEGQGHAKQASRQASKQEGTNVAVGP